MGAVVTPRPAAPGARDVRRAWWCVAAFPLALVVGFVGGEWVPELLGHGVEGVAPWWVGGLALLPFLVAAGIPTALAWRFHRRARAAGDQRALVPALILLVLAGGFVVINLFSWLMWALLEAS